MAAFHFYMISLGSIRRGEIWLGFAQNQDCAEVDRIPVIPALVR
jgi:hypothetical protein